MHTIGKKYTSTKHTKKKKKSINADSGNIDVLL